MEEFVERKREAIERLKKRIHKIYNHMTTLDSRGKSTIVTNAYIYFQTLIDIINYVENNPNCIIPALNEINKDYNELINLYYQFIEEERKKGVKISYFWE